MAILPPNIAHASFFKWPQLRALFDALPQARLVGGCVRDALIDVPCDDIDLATPMLPEEVMQTLQSYGIACYPTGIEHGTITARVDEKNFQITTLREDMACDGRHAQVEFSTSWKKDALRRDFTINALYATPDGEVIDEVGRITDIDARLLRFIGNPHDRIVEDALRILRFFRFAAQLEFAMDAPSLAACIHHAARMKHLSGERVREELFKLLARMENSDVLALMLERGVLQPLLAAPLQLPVAKGEAPEITLAWMLPKGDVESARIIQKSLKLSNAQSQLLEKVVATPAPQTLAEAKALLRTHGETIFRAVTQFSEASAEIKMLPNVWRAPEFPVKGSDLLALGLQEGKALGDALKELEKRWEFSDYSLSKAELLRSV